MRSDIMNTDIYIYKETNLVAKVLTLSDNFNSFTNSLIWVTGIIVFIVIAIALSRLLASKDITGVRNVTLVVLTVIGVVGVAGFVISGFAYTIKVADYMDEVIEAVHKTKKETATVIDIEGTHLSKHYTLRYSDNSEGVLTTDTKDFIVGDVLTFKVMPVGFTKENWVDDVVKYKNKAKELFIEKGKKDNTLLVFVKAETKEEYKERTKE